MKCPACNTELKVVYYQRRAADEPPDLVQYCERCPLDTSRLSTKDSYIGFTSIYEEDKPVSLHYKNKASTSVNKQIQSTVVCTLISVEGMAAQRCYNQLTEDKVQFSSITGSTTVLQVGSKKELVTLYSSSVLKDKVLLKSEERKVAPFVNVYTASLLTLSALTTKSTDIFILGKEYKLTTLPGTDSVYFRTSFKDKNSSVNILVKRNGDGSTQESTCLKVIQKILSKYGTENSIKSFIDSRFISTLYVQSARAFDYNSAPEENYTYTWKPDGERFWYVKYGCVWLFCRKLLSGKIVGWNMSRTLNTVKKAGPVLDVELMIGHDPILIDVLALESGMPTSALRDLSSILQAFKSIKQLDIPIHVRPYFSTEKELLRVKPELNYPIDGIVGIENGGTTIIKLKTERSIELELQDNGNLVSSEGILVAESELYTTYAVGSIVELRFIKDSTRDVPRVTETILRTDKTKANEYSVCQEIMKMITSMPDTLARRKALLWCNSVRQRIHQIAAKYEGKGRVILDIGSGDGQAVSDYSDNPTVTYILIEPDLNKCKKLERRLLEPGRGRCTLFTDSNQLGKAIQSVSKATIKYAIICTSIESILNETHSIRMLKNCIRCCVASYSISHTFAALNNLALEGIQVIGCGYLYDKVEPGSYLVNEFGVVMKRTSKSTAYVKWGADRKYDEFPITSSDFKGILYERPGTELIPVVKDKENGLLNTVSTKVYVISSKKNI